MLVGMQVSELRIGDQFHDITPDEYAALSASKKGRLATFTVGRLEEPKTCVGHRHLVVSRPENGGRGIDWCYPLTAEVVPANV